MKKNPRVFILLGFDSRLLHFNLIKSRFFPKNTDLIFLFAYFPIKNSKMNILSKKKILVLKNFDEKIQKNHNP